MESTFDSVGNVATADGEMECEWSACSHSCFKKSDVSCNQYRDYVATAIRLLCRVSKVIYFECYGFDCDNSRLGSPNDKQIGENEGFSSSSTPPRRDNSKSPSPTMAKSTHSEQKSMMKIVVLDPPGKLTMILRSKCLWYAQPRTSRGLDGQTRYHLHRLLCVSWGGWPPIYGRSHRLYISAEFFSYI